MANYRVVSNHPEDLADGRTVAPGEEVGSVDEKDVHNARLIELGRLVKVESPKAAAKKQQTTEEGGND